MSFTIRSASETDALTLLNLIKELASYEKLSDQVVATEESLRYWLFEMKRAEALVFEVDHSIIGFALYFYNFSTFLGKAGLYLEDLYIQPNYRHKGYGIQVFKYLAKLAIDKGCGRMEWSVLDWNTPSIKFYKQLGALSMDDWTSYRLTEKELIRLVE